MFWDLRKARSLRELNRNNIGWILQQFIISFTFFDEHIFVFTSFTKDLVYESNVLILRKWYKHDIYIYKYNFYCIKTNVYWHRVWLLPVLNFRIIMVFQVPSLI